MILHTAIGDAYGLGWEFADGPSAQHAANDLSAFRVNPRYPEYPAGRYTDDTLRTLANSAVVLGSPSGWYDPAAYAAAYQRIHALDGRKGWSRGFQAHLDAHRESSPLQFMLALRRRATNGAVMGVAPLGFLPNEDIVRMAATAQCVSTHSGAAASSAQTVALAAHYLIYDKGPIDQLADYLEQEVDWASEDECNRTLCKRWSPVPVPAMPAWTIAAGAVFIVASTTFTGMADRLQFAIKRGGDTDSLGAVTMALCSCAKAIPDDLPSSLTDHIEDEDGRAMLRSVDLQLRAFAGL
ncbi:ADP-ribosylglycohydrolase family protein [Sphingomonas sp. 3-13AW]|uniref:ADP-ribosylglycohydrolase family protein n=1 Tax=Sphingomonas sp. 3-13AW TaxID=3050450 RepID=UPI003BB7E2B1